MNEQDEATARRLLNRAVTTSPSDCAYLEKLTTVAAASPDVVLRVLLNNGSLDVQQADVAHRLLLRVPELATSQSPSDGEPRICAVLLKLLASPAKLSEPRCKAMLLLLSRLVCPWAQAPVCSTGQRDPHAQRVEARDDALRHVELQGENSGSAAEPARGDGKGESGDGGSGRSSGCFDDANAENGDSESEVGVGKEGEEEGEESSSDETESSSSAAAAANQPSPSPLSDGGEGGDGVSCDVSTAPLSVSAPLLNGSQMLRHVLVPSLARVRASTTLDAPLLALALQATVELVSGHPSVCATSLPAESLQTQLCTSALLSLISHLLSFVNQRAEMGVEIVAPLLQSTQTCVQLLLPRVSALAKQAATEPASEAAASLADAICEWRNLPWRTQLYVWPLVDRTVRSGGGACAGQLGKGESVGLPRCEEGGLSPVTTAGSAADRFLLFLRRHVDQGELGDLGSLVVALTMAAAIPGLPVRAALRSVFGSADSATMKAAAAAAAADSDPMCDSLLAAVAVGLSRAGTPAEWRLAVSTLFPAVATRLHARRTTQAQPVPSDVLLECLLVLQSAASREDSRASPSACVSWLAFALGFARWMAAAAKDCDDAAGLARLFGAATRAAASSPAIATDRFFIVLLQLYARLVAMAVAPQPRRAAEHADASGGDGAPAGGFGGGGAVGCGGDAGVRRWTLPQLVDASHRCVRSSTLLDMQKAMLVDQMHAVVVGAVHRDQDDDHDRDFELTP